MSTTSQAQERIDLRTSPEIKQLIVRAASTAGMSVSAFLLGTAQERAKQTLDDADRRRPKLSAAMKRYRARMSAKR